MKFEDQRSTGLAVDNLGGATILGRIIRVDHTRYKPKEGEVVDENAYQNSGEKPTDKNNQDRRGKRRSRRDDDSGDDGDRRRKSSSPKMLKEELELQKLIRDHDEEDPMKAYLIQQKKEDLEKALRDLKKKKKHRHGKEKSDGSEHGHRSHRHESRSKESTRHHRSRSKDHRYPIKSHEETDHARYQSREARRGRTDKERIRDNCVRTEMTVKNMPAKADTTKWEHGKESGQET